MYVIPLVSPTTSENDYEHIAHTRGTETIELLTPLGYRSIERASRCNHSYRCLRPVYVTIEQLLRVFCDVLRSWQFIRADEFTYLMGAVIAGSAIAATI